MAQKDLPLTMRLDAIREITQAIGAPVLMSSWVLRHAPEALDYYEKHKFDGKWKKEIRAYRVRYLRHLAACDSPDGEPRTNGAEACDSGYRSSS